MNTVTNRSPFFGKFLMAIALMIFTSASIFAQDAKETAAGLYNDGLALLKEKNYAEGLVVMEKALALAETEENEKVVGLAKKNGSKACYNLAKSKYKAKDYAGAMDLYKKGAELNADNPSNYGGMANVMKKDGKTAEAVDMYIKAANMYKADNKTKKVASMMKKVNYLVGKSYTDKDYDNAIAMGTKSMEVMEDDALAYYMSRSYIEKGSHAEALTMATKSIEIAGENVEDKYYIALALANVGLGNKADAIKAYEKVTEEKYLEQAKYQIGQLKG